MLPRKRVGPSPGPRAADRLNLAQLPIGQAAQIESIVGSDALASRLLEMGLTPGRTTRVLGTAFSGDPIEIEIRDYRLTLRRREAERVILAPTANGGE